MKTKVCTKCGIEKPLDQFYRHKASADGRRPDCKRCYGRQHLEYERRPEVKAKKSLRAKIYNANLTEIQKCRRAATLAKYNERTPRLALLQNRSNALHRHPTANPITIEELLGLWRRQEGRCAVTRFPMTWKQGRIKPTSISLDRLDPAKGYESGNVRLVCYSVNAFRNTMTDSEMLMMAKSIVANLDRPEPLPGLLSLVG